MRHLNSYQGEGSYPEPSQLTRLRRAFLCWRAWCWRSGMPTRGEVWHWQHSAEKRRWTSSVELLPSCREPHCLPPHAAGCLGLLSVSCPWLTGATTFPKFFISSMQNRTCAAISYYPVCGSQSERLSVLSPILTALLVLLRVPLLSLFFKYYGAPVTVQHVC